MRKSLEPVTIKLNKWNRFLNKEAYLMSYKKSAEDILQAIGGEENLDAIAHCATRLRLVLNDESKVDEETLNNMDVVKGTFSTGDSIKSLLIWDC